MNEENTGDRAKGQWLRTLCCSSRGPGFNSQNPHGSSILSVTLATGDPAPSQRQI